MSEIIANKIKDVIKKAEQKLFELIRMECTLVVSQIRHPDVRAVLSQAYDIWDTTANEVFAKKTSEHVCMRICIVLISLSHTTWNHTVLAHFLGYKTPQSINTLTELAASYLFVKDPLFLKYYLPVKHLIQDAKV